MPMAPTGIPALLANLSGTNRRLHCAFIPAKLHIVPVTRFRGCRDPLVCELPSNAKNTNLKWACMSGCGACCFLGDYDFTVLESMLKKPEDVDAYLGMISSDGWCSHFDKGSRSCTIYDSRPRFCRVELDVFSDLYGVRNEAELNDFAIQCCEEHISEVFPNLDDESSESSQLSRFHHFIQEQEAASD